MEPLLRHLTLSILIVLHTAALVTSAFGTSPVFDESKRILQEVKVTSYQHQTDIDESTGTYQTDCSGFAAYVLKKAALDSLSQLEEALRQNFSPAPKRPLAKHFVWFFSRIAALGEKNWQEVTLVRDLQEGDILSWLTPDNVESVNTGHVMIVAHTPTPAAGEASEWLVDVNDSTSSGHGGMDPRKKAGPNGVGAGTIGLLVDEKGAPSAYRWKGKESKKSYTTEIRMGRATPLARL